MVHGRLLTVEIRDVDLILHQALLMNKHEVPSYYGSLANNTTKELRRRLMNDLWEEYGVGNDGVGTFHAEFSNVCSTRVKVLARKRFSKFQCEDASGIHDTSLLFFTECDADIRKNLYTNFMPSSGTAMFQGAVERMTKEPTVLAPFTMSVFGIFCLMWTSHCAASPCYSARH